MLARNREVYHELDSDGAAEEDHVDGSLYEQVGDWNTNIRFVTRRMDRTTKS